MHNFNNSGIVNPMKTFTDWAGIQIPYRFVPGVPDTGTREVCCEIDPYGLDQWYPMGHGSTAEKALEAAKANWKDFDSKD